MLHIPNDAARAYVAADGAAELIFLVLDSLGDPATGRATIRVRMYRRSDGQFLDWSDMTFKAAGWTTLDATMTEVDAVNAPGHYALTGGFDASAVTNAAADDTYVTVPSQTAGTDTLPGPGELLMGSWVNSIEAVRDRIG